MLVLGRVRTSPVLIRFDMARWYDFGSSASAGAIPSVGTGCTVVLVPLIETRVSRCAVAVDRVHFVVVHSCVHFHCPVVGGYYGTVD